MNVFKSFFSTFKNCVTHKAFLLLTLSTLFTGTAHAITPWYSSVGSHIILLNPDGTVWSIGSNNHGQLGIGKSDNEIHEPVMVPGLSKVKAVAAGANHSVALLQNGTVWTWGGNDSGQLGIGSRIDNSEPVQVYGLQDIIAIASGRTHVVALKKDGTVWSWGSNFSGQLGMDTSGTSSQPVKNPFLSGITAITAGAFHTAALKNDGTVWAWGFNGNGQLGNGTCENYNIPVKVNGLTNVMAIAAGNQHTVALQDNGTAWTWGSNHAGQMGDSTSEPMSLVPRKMASIKGVIDVTAKVNHTFALMQDGTVIAWGDSGSGQWGNGLSMSGSHTPVRLHGVSSLVSIAAIGDPATLAKRSTATNLSSRQRTDEYQHEQVISNNMIAIADSADFLSF